MKYKDLQCLDVQANSIELILLKISISAYLQTNYVLQTTYSNGGDTGYKPVRASAFNNASLEQYKTDIKNGIMML